MLLQVALNGSRAPAEHPALPITPEHLARAAAQAVAAGAGAIHLHVRGPDGAESLAPDDVARTLACVRAACPQIPVGISTTAAIAGDAQRRYDLVAQWTVQPDYVSVNIHEAGALELIGLLAAKGIGVEAGVWNAAAAARFTTSPVAGRCIRILIEALENDLAAARDNVAAIEAVLNQGRVACPRLLHGEGAPAWDLVRDALARGYDTRVGLEDMLTLPDGTSAANNAALVAVARQWLPALPPL